MREFTTFVWCILHEPRSQLRRVHRFVQQMMYRFFLTFITRVIVAYMAYTRVMCASMHVLFPVRKFLLCAIAFTPGKLRVVLKIADQSRAGSHFNLQNTHSQFRNSHFTHARCYALRTLWDQDSSVPRLSLALTNDYQ